MSKGRPWPTVIAVDFDGTLCESKWPEIGEPYWPIIHELIRRQAAGARIVLWTCRSGELLDNAVSWCLCHGIQFDAINSNVAERITQYGDDTRKVSADEYWDDRNVLESGGRLACRCLWQKKAGLAYRSGRKTQGKAKARSVFRAPQGGKSLLQAEADCYWMQTWEATTVTCAERKRSGRLRNWLKTWITGLRRGRHETD